jgi:hypothetical protein
MSDTATWDELLWAVAAFVGLALHVRNLWRIHGPLPDPKRHQDERDVIVMFRVADGIRVFIKVVMLFGAIYVMSQPPPVMDTPGEFYQFTAWRTGLILVTLALNVETWWQGWMRARLRVRWRQQHAPT